MTTPTARVGSRRVVLRRVAPLLVVTAAFWASPAATNFAWAEVPITADEQVEFTATPDADPADGQETSAVAEPELAFSAFALQLPVAGVTEARVRQPDGAWGEWFEVAPLPLEEGPDVDSPEFDPTTWSEPIWVEHADAIQVRVDGVETQDVTATVIDSNQLNGLGTKRVRVDTPAASADAAAGRPRIRSRAEWGADESLNNSSPSISDAGAGAAIIHHTATPNGYSASNVPAIMRSIHHYHTQSRGWADVGYNFVVDKYGNIWEGRAGGIDKAVIGAHAAGFNTTSIGVSIIGDYENGSVHPWSAYGAIAKLLAWKFSVHGISPRGRHTWPNGITHDTVIGHRDTGGSQTSCPGSLVHGRLDALAYDVSRIMATNDAFIDVSSSSPYLGGITSLDLRGVTEGCERNKYCPDRLLRRGEAATFLGRGFQIAESAGRPFADVPDDSVHAGYITAFAERGVIQGFGDGTFGGKLSVTRGQVALMLQRMLRLGDERSKFSSSRYADGRFRFSDIEDDGVFAGAVYALNNRGILPGCTETRLCSGQRVSRGAMAQILDAALEYRDNRNSP